MTDAGPNMFSMAPGDEQRASAVSSRLSSHRAAEYVLPQKPLSRGKGKGTLSSQPASLMGRNEKFSTEDFQRAAAGEIPDHSPQTSVPRVHRWHDAASMAWVSSATQLQYSRPPTSPATWIQNAGAFEPQKATCLPPATTTGAAAEADCKSIASPGDALPDIPPQPVSLGLPRLLHSTEQGTLVVTMLARPLDSAAGNQQSEHAAGPPAKPNLVAEGSQLEHMLLSKQGR